MENRCTKCKTNLANATGVVCDECMMQGEGVVIDAPAPLQQIVDPVPPTATDEDNDSFDSFTKKFNDGISVAVVINYTKNFSEIRTYKDDILVDANTYTDKELFEKELSSIIKKIEDAEKKAKKLEEERKKYFEGIKSTVGDLGFELNDK